MKTSTLRRARYIVGLLSIGLLVCGALGWIWLSPTGGGHAPSARVFWSGAVFAVLFGVMTQWLEMQLDAERFRV